MLKILESKQEAFELIGLLAKQDFLQDFRIGATGSFMENTMKKSSSVDIVLKLKEDGDKDLIGSISLLRSINSFLGTHYHHKFNILWLDLLEKDENALLTYINSEGIAANPESVYMNVVDSLQWDSDSIKDEEDDEEDDEFEDDENDEIEIEVEE